MWAHFIYPSCNLQRGTCVGTLFLLFIVSFLTASTSASRYLKQH